MKKRFLSVIIAFIMLAASILPAVAAPNTSAGSEAKQNLLQNEEQGINIQAQISDAIVEQGVKSEKSNQLVELLIVADGKDITKELSKIAIDVDKKSSSVYVISVAANKAKDISKITEIKAVGRDRMLYLPKPVQIKDFYVNANKAYPNMEYSHESTDITTFWQKGYDGKGTTVGIIDTGVEPGNELLTLTTDGKIKIVDYQDFWEYFGADSEGDVRLDELVVKYETTKKYVEYKGSTIYLPNTVGNRVLIGLFNEDNLNTEGGGNHDVNNNSMFNDKILVVVANYEDNDKSNDLIYVDSNMNNNLSDDKALGIYKEVVKSFKDKVIFEMNNGKPVIENGKPKVKAEYQSDYSKLLGKFNNLQMGKNAMGTVYNFVISTVEMRDGQWLVNLGYDGNSHGSHVAGDATANGYKVLPFIDTKIVDSNGNQISDGTIKGAAPGAQVIACRVFQSEGGTPESVYMAAMEYCSEHGADVINMSLGSLPDINDGVEPNCQLVNILSKKYGTIFCISAGNEGPSTNAIGTPGASEWAFTIGAYNPAWLNYGSPQVPDGLWYFSSRGPTEDGRLKPTIIAPGSMISSVPMWDSEKVRETQPGGGTFVGYARMEGTSMASPYAAGTIAALKQAINENGIPYHPLVVKEAIFESGNKNINNKVYVPSEVGGGMIDPNAALIYLKNLKASGLGQEELKSGSEYIDRTQMVVKSEFDYTEKLSYKPEGLYVRDGDIPSAVTVTLTNTTNRDLNLNLTKDSYNYSNDWLTLPQSSIALKKGEAKVLTLAIDKTKLSTRINSLMIKMDDPNTTIKEGFIPITVINYLDLSATNSVVTENQERDFKPGAVDKHFVRIPYGAQRVDIVLEMAEPSDPTNLLPMVTPPSGIQAGDIPGAEWIYSMKSQTTIILNNPEPGTWEVDLFSGLITDIDSAKGRHKLTAKIKGIAFGPSVIKYSGRSGEYKEQDISMKLLNATNNDSQSIILKKTNMVNLDANKVMMNCTASYGEQGIVYFSIPEKDTNVFTKIQTRHPQGTADDSDIFDLRLYRVMTDSTGVDKLSSLIAQSTSGGADEDINVENLAAGKYAIIMDAFEGAHNSPFTLMYQVANSSNGENVIAIRNDKVTLSRELGDMTMGVRVPAKTGKYLGLIYAVDAEGNVLGKAKVETISEGTENNLSLNYDEMVRLGKGFDITLDGEIKEPNNLNNIYGIEFELTFDPDKVAAESLLNGDIFKGVAVKELMRKIQDGKITYAIGFLNTEKNQNAMGAISGNIAKIKLNAKNLGTVAIKFDKLLVVNHIGDEIAINIVADSKILVVNPDLVNSDGTVNIREVCKLAYRLGKSSKDAGFDANLDLNKDGNIDFKDFNFVIKCFNEDN